MPRFKPRHYYPIGLDISDCECLVVGGGKVAERKIRRLLEYGAKVRVVSPDLTPHLMKWADEGKLRHQHARFQPCHFQKPVLVFAATNDLKLNQKIVQLAARKGVFVNVAKPGRTSGFIVPAIVKRPLFVVAISTDGRSPQTAKRIQKELEKIL